MEQSRVLYFQDTYSRMSDDELAYLVATRTGSLVEEAQLALSNVLQTRNLENIETELEETVADLDHQAQYASRRMQEERDRQRLIRKVFHCCFAFFSALGLYWMFFGDKDAGLIFVLLGLAGSALLELSRLAGRLIVKLFTMS